VDALADLAVRFRFVDLGMKVFLRDQQTPEALGALQKARIEKWWPIIKEFGIKADDLRSPVRSTAPDHPGCDWVRLTPDRVRAQARRNQRDGSD
jgi:hypothetical protein